MKKQECEQKMKMETVYALALVPYTEREYLVHNDALCLYTAWRDKAYPVCANSVYQALLDTPGMWLCISAT